MSPGDIAALVGAFVALAGGLCAIFAKVAAIGTMVGRFTQWVLDHDARHEREERRVEELARHPSYRQRSNR